MEGMDFDQGQSSAYAERYERWAAPWRARPRALAALSWANRLIVWLFYGAYGVLLVKVALTAPLAAVALVALPAMGFALLSAARARVNAPRPYEGTGLVPLLSRDSQGRSFPSRHAFSAFTIASCWWYASPSVSAALLAAGVLLGLIRVGGGVHYPRDVVVGALCGIATGSLAVITAGVLVG